MFKTREYHHRNSFFPLVLFRVVLSLAMFLILGLVAYQAFRYFSGATLDADILKTDPRKIIDEIKASDKSPEAIMAILGLKTSQGAEEQSVREEKSSSLQRPTPVPSGKRILRFALVADSHNDSQRLTQALKMAEDQEAKFVIGLGDYSDTGTLAELQKAKEVFEASGLPYYTTAGDHDLWDARDKGLSASARFTEVFGSPYESFVDSNIRFIILYNSDNYLGVDALQRKWLDGTLSEAQKEGQKPIFVLMHEALSHPSSDRVMGKGNSEITSQAQELVKLLKDLGVSEAFSGDIHAFTRYRDKETGLNMTTVGAVTEQRNLSLPRFALVDVYEGGGYNIQDVEIKSEP
ncbi:MAG: metallophosphoesterase [bacterium]|nr:metallophosphoesterase [bacterium]